jgi:hypothetical protein
VKEEKPGREKEPIEWDREAARAEHRENNNPYPDVFDNRGNDEYDLCGAADAIPALFTAFGGKGGGIIVSRHEQGEEGSEEAVFDRGVFWRKLRWTIRGAAL